MRTQKGREARIHYCQAFTLIELLVVIAIIGVVAGLLIPVLSKAGDKSKTIKCVNQQKQLYLAVRGYAQDNNNLLLTSGTSAGNRWAIMLKPYIPAGGSSNTNTYESSSTFGNIFKCPAADPAAVANGGSVGVYGYNESLVAKSFAALSKPAATILIGCNSGLNGGGQFLNGSAPSSRATKYGWTGSTIENGPSPNHGPMCNFLFADGHVESRIVTDATAWPWKPTNAITTIPN